LGVTEWFQGFETKTRRLPASTTLGYENEADLSEKKHQKFSAEV